MKHLRHWHRSYCDQRQLTFKCNFLPVLFCKKHWCGHYNELIKQYKGCDSYYDWLCLTCTKNDVLAMRWKRQALQFPAGGFFLFARVCKEVVPLIPANCLVMPNKATPTGLVRPDWALCQWMAEEIGLLCIPSGPFFSPERASVGDYSDHFVRIAFCKTDETIDAAAATLTSLQRMLLPAETSSTTGEFESVPSELR